MKLKTVVIVAAVLAATGCASIETSEGTGTLIGAIAGAAVGAAIDGKRGAAIGAAVGGALGNRLGAYLDEQERKEALAAARQAVTLPTDEKEHWEVRDEEDQQQVTASGWVTPTSDIYESNGRSCRDVTFVSQKDGREHTERQTLCETPQGWVTA